MADRIKLASVGDLPPGSCKVVEAQGRALAIYNVDGTVYATDNKCLHQGGPLGDGLLEGSLITCPWHAWQYDVTTGASVFNPDIKLKTLAVTVEGDDILLED